MPEAVTVGLWDHRGEASGRQAEVWDDGGKEHFGPVGMWLMTLEMGWRGLISTPVFICDGGVPNKPVHGLDLLVKHNRNPLRHDWEAEER